jgi:hypothetical protein
MKRYAIIGIALLGGGLFFGQGISGELRPLAPEYSAPLDPPMNPMEQQTEVHKTVDHSVYLEFKDKASTWTSERKEKLRRLFHKKIEEAAAGGNFEEVKHYGKLLALLDGNPLKD